MIYDLQKASMLKRISAWLLDIILLAIVAAGFALLFSELLGFDGYNETLNNAYAKYEQQYGIQFDISHESYDALSQEQKDLYQTAYNSLSADREAVYAYNMLMQLSVLITTLGIFFAYLLLEFAIPLWLKNGQSVGKKVFGIAIMRADGVQITPVALFIRTVLGKYTIGTMIPVLIVMMIFWGSIGILGPIILGLIGLLQLILLIVSKTNSAIHDYLANTVTVDFSSQLIFRTTEELIAYQKRVAAEQAAKKPY